MKIFVSHALRDSNLLTKIIEALQPYGITLLVAEHYEDMSHTISEKIEEMIRTCDVGLVLLTDNGFDSKFVQQEIGYLKSSKKPILQIVQMGIEKRLTGFLYGRGYIWLNPANPDLAIKKMARTLLRYWNGIQIKRKKQKEEEESRKMNFLVGVGLFAGVLLLLSSKK